MRVGLVYTGCFRQAGVERIVWESARHLAERHDVTVLADYWEESGAPVTYRRVHPRMRPRFLLPNSFSTRAGRAMREGGYDRVVSYGANCPGGDVLWVSSVHRAWLERACAGETGARRAKAMLRFVRPVNRSLLSLERALFSRRDYRRVITTSDRVAEDLERLYGVPRGDTVTIGNGFAPEDFSPERRRELREEARAEIGLADEDVALLMVANELPRKGFGVLLDAVRLVGDPRLRVLLAGRVAPKGYDLSGVRVAYLGLVSDLGRLHAAADLFVLPTRYEAACLSIVEALGSGLPVITTDVPGAGDLIEHGVNGLLQHDPLDPEELAELLRLGLDENERRRWSEAAGERARPYAWHNLIARVEEVLAA